MPEIEIRPANAADIPRLAALDHRYTTDHVWQMEVDQDQEGAFSVAFREMRLPRVVRVEYPRPPADLTSDWTHMGGLLVALLGGRPIGYAGLLLDRLPGAAWVSDLMVDPQVRGKGVATGLLLAAAEWAVSMDRHLLVLEMQPKNDPAIRLALKLGFEFCGYNDSYYANHEIGMFFRKVV